MTQTRPETPEPTRSAEAGSGCCGDPYAGLPPEARPKSPARAETLRETRCPGCGLVYRTNRSADICIRCM